MLKASSSAGGILSAILAAPGQSPNRPEDVEQALARLMYERGPGLTMRTRLISQQIEDSLLAVAYSRHVGFKPIQDLAFLMFELLVSQDGQGRREFMERGPSRTDIPYQRLTRDPALED